MKKTLPTLTLLLTISTFINAQQIPSGEKECRISAGAGYANATQNATGGFYDWLRLDYRVLSNFSLATEFEYMNFSLPGYLPDYFFTNFQNVQKLHDNNFALLIKYHFLTKSKLKIALASGWSYYVRQNEYYASDESEDTSGTEEIYPNESSSSGYMIPFLGEVQYPVSRKINAELRIKYNLNAAYDASTYSAGVGLSLKL